MAEILRDDQVGREFLESFGVDGVKAFAARDIFANQPVDFRRRRVFRDSRLDDHVFGAGGGREVAFVADADDFVGRSPGRREFRWRTGEARRYA